MCMIKSTLCWAQWREPGVLAIHLYASSQDGDGCVGWAVDDSRAELEVEVPVGVVYRSVVTDCELRTAHCGLGSGRKR